MQCVGGGRGCQYLESWIPVGTGQHSNPFLLANLIRGEITKRLFVPVSVCVCVLVVGVLQEEIKDGHFRIER